MAACIEGVWTCPGTGCDAPEPAPCCEDCYEACEDNQWVCVGSPIVLDVYGTGFHLTDIRHGVRFRVLPSQGPRQMSWPEAEFRNGWLALDRNGDGEINDFTELFGNATPQPKSEHPNGYRALAVFDDPANGGNGNGFIDPGDAVYSHLRIWIDDNHNGISEPASCIRCGKQAFSESTSDTSFPHTWMRTETSSGTNPRSGTRLGANMKCAMTCSSKSLTKASTMRLFASIALLLGAFAVRSTPQASQCAVLQEDKKKALVEYVRAKYTLPGSVALKLAADTLAPGTCFHQLTFQGVSTLKTWELTLYLSPDGRYLTSDLFDTTLNPAEEERHKTQALMAGLSENKGASLGAPNAPVTIVEFSDFECP